MGPLFFKSNKNFDEVVKEFFGFLHLLEHVSEGDSVNVLGGFYYDCSLLGMNIRLEQNSYDYEDDFNYTIFIKKDFDSAIKINEDIEESMITLILKLMSLNLNIEIGVEKNDKLHIVLPTSLE